MGNRTIGLWAAVLVGCGGVTPAMRATESNATAVKVATSPPASAAPSAPPCARRRPGTGAARAPGDAQGNGVALARIGARTLAYAADADDDAIHTFDVDRAVEIAVTPIGGAPAQILVLPDGRVAATLASTNRVAIFEPGERAEDPLSPLCDAAAPAEPWGLAATPDGARLVVTSGYGRALSVLDTAGLATVRQARLPRDPRSVVLDEDGRRAFVTHMVDARVSIVDLADSDAAVRTAFLRPSNGGNAPGTQGFALARLAVERGAPARIFAPLTAVSPGAREVTSGYGSSGGASTVLPLVAVIDPAAEHAMGGGHRVAGGHHRRDCLLPRAAAATGDGTVLVACQGIDALVELDARSFDPVNAERRRFRVPSGPTGVAADAAGRRAIVWSQFARELAVVDLGAPPPRGESAPIASAVTRVPGARRAATRLTPEEERGRALFFTTDDPRTSRDGLACASCHPDGRDDALTWSTPDGPRQTIMLAGRVAESAPYGWFGKHPSLRHHVTQTLARLGGSGLGRAEDRRDLDALLAYLTAMRGPTTEGAARDPVRAALAARGREVFSDAGVGCARCHYAGGSDGGRHDVKSGNVDERSLRFDTPSLRFVGGSAPYFHDGRYATVEELLRGSDGLMGHTLHLSPPDLIALTAYLEDM